MQPGRSGGLFRLRDGQARCIVETLLALPGAALSANEAMRVLLGHCFLRFRHRAGAHEIHPPVRKMQVYTSKPIVDSPASQGYHRRCRPR